MATRDWAAEVPDCKTIIWDTMSTTAEDLLVAITAQGLHGKRPEYGTPGTDAYVPQSVPGDYGAAQRSVKHILGLLFRQPLNVFVLFHAATDDDDGKGELIGGPATVGKASIRTIAGAFDNLFRLSTDRVKIKDGPPPTYEHRRVVQLDGKGYWQAGIRSPGKVRDYVLPEDPMQFWIDTVDQMKGMK